MSDFMKVRRSAWLPLSILAMLVLVAAAAISFVPSGTSRVDRVRADALLSPKGDLDDEMKPGRNAEAAVGANEQRNPDSTPDVQAYLQRAYPGKDIPTDSSFAARVGWASLDSESHSGGRWRLIGPSVSVQPGVLNALGDGAQVVTAGRVTAMAIAPTCTNRSCVIYVAAAGGGVWRTRNGLDNQPDWTFTSGSFGTNAMGSLLIDPRDSSGNTIYAGTGEPNASADSEAGVGIYKSTNGGRDWSLVPGSDIFFQRSIGQLALDKDGNLLVPLASGVRGISSADGAISSGSTDHPLITRGLYRQTGSTFSLIWPAPAPTRGSTAVAVDPTHSSTIYVNAFQQGIWRSIDNGATFSQIFVPQDPTVLASALDRSEFALTTLPSGATRMYVGEGQGGGAGHHSNFFRSDNADTAATFTSLGGMQVDNYCDGQCWYDNLVVTPAGHPDIVYLMGSFDYGLFFGGFNNGRAVLLSTDAGVTWSDLTQDTKRPNANATHPDQHAMVINPNNPYQYWEGSDGGVVRTDGHFGNVAYKCDARGLTGAANDYCKSLLWRVPRSLSSMNKGFSTLQFQSLSVSRQNPLGNLQGGTQDNGTWQYYGNPVIWTQEIYGDGGQSGFAAATDHLRFNTFTGQANDVNFQNGDPTKWVIASGPIITSPEASYFYPPVIADPHPANGKTIFQGSFSVWRTQDWAGSQAFLEANCPEFTTSAATATCGDFVIIGPPGQTDLTDSGIYGAPVYGTDRIGGAVAVLQRSTGSRDTGTMWVATGAGRIFLTKNANDAADKVQWTRIDNTSAVSPSRYPSGIYVDPRNKNHAWVSYSGYNVNTPTTPGHVFEVTWNGTVATFTDISNNLPDFPITSIVRDDETGDLYASSDFGVMRLGRHSSTWTVAGSGLPMVEVPNLQIVPGARILYAATHGRSAWALRLPED